MHLRSKASTSVIGRITDPKIAVISGTDRKVCEFSIAHNEGFYDKEGKWNDRATWYNLVTFNKSHITYIEKSVQKGSLVQVDCQFFVDERKGKDGQVYKNPKFEVKEIVLLDGGKKKENEEKTE